MIPFYAVQRPCHLNRARLSPTDLLPPSVRAPTLERTVTSTHERPGWFVPQPKAFGEGARTNPTALEQTGKERSPNENQ